MLNDRKQAMQSMESAAASVAAIAVEQPDAMPRQLVAMWLLRVAYTLCGPMGATAAGNVHLRSALEYWPECLEDNELRSSLELCQQCAEDEQCQREERNTADDQQGQDAAEHVYHSIAKAVLGEAVEDQKTPR